MSIEASERLNQLLNALKKELPIKFFGLLEIPEAVAWAERGGIAIHENFHTKRRHSYHVISASRESLEAFCRKVNVSPENIRASEFYRFWHLTWVPFTPPPKKKRPRGRPPKHAS